MIRTTGFAIRRSVAINQLVHPRNSRGFVISSALKTQDKEVQVATYAKGNKPGTERTTIVVNRSKGGSKPTPVEDDERKAVAFDRSIVSKMTPTIKSFTLEGKVAVITGYVLS